MRTHQQGQYLIEIVLALGLFIIFVSALSLLAVDSSRTVRAQQFQLLSVLALQNTTEAIHSIANTGWDALPVGIHGVEMQNNHWVLTSSPNTSNDLTTTVAIAYALRDAQGNISTTGTADQNSKTIHLTVSRASTGTALFDSSLLFVRNNSQSLAYWEETTQRDFSDGTLRNTVVTTIGDGEITLRSGRTKGRYISSRFRLPKAKNILRQIEWQATTPAQTSVRVQIRVAKKKHQINSAQWFGPDGTSATFFSQTDTIAVPATIAHYRYVQYRVELTGTQTISPSFEDIRIYYE